MTDNLSRVIRILEAADWPPPLAMPLTVSETAGRFTDSGLSRVLYLSPSVCVCDEFTRTVARGDPSGWGTGPLGTYWTYAGDENAHEWVDGSVGHVDIWNGPMRVEHGYYGDYVTWDWGYSILSLLGVDPETGVDIGKLPANGPPFSFSFDLTVDSVEDVKRLLGWWMSVQVAARDFRGSGSDFMAGYSLVNIAATGDEDVPSDVWGDLTSAPTTVTVSCENWTAWLGAPSYVLPIADFLGHAWSFRVEVRGEGTVVWMWPQGGDAPTEPVCWVTTEPDPSQRDDWRDDSGAWLTDKVRVAVSGAATPGYLQLVSDGEGGWRPPGGDPIYPSPPHLDIGEGYSPVWPGAVGTTGWYLRHQCLIPEGDGGYWWPMWFDTAPTSETPEEWGISQGAVMFWSNSTGGHAMAQNGQHTLGFVAVPGARSVSDTTWPYASHTEWSDDYVVTRVRLTGTVSASFGAPFLTDNTPGISSIDYEVYVADGCGSIALSGAVLASGTVTGSSNGAGGWGGTEALDVEFDIPVGQFQIGIRTPSDPEALCLAIGPLWFTFGYLIAAGFGVSLSDASLTVAETTLPIPLTPIQPWPTQYDGVVGGVVDFDNLCICTGGSGWVAPANTPE